MTETITSSSALNRRDVTRDIFSASIGSVACCYTGQPFDTVKVRMQTNPLSYPSVLFTTRSIMTNEGMVAFWKGAVPTAMGMVAENAMAFGVNEALKRTFPDDAKEDPTKRPDLIRPFLMVRSILLLIAIIRNSSHLHVAGTFRGAPVIGSNNGMLLCNSFTSK